MKDQHGIVTATGLAVTCHECVPADQGPTVLEVDETDKFVPPVEQFALVYTDNV
jgi:hypothetical protein